MDPVLNTIRNNCRKQRHAIEHRLKESKIDLLEQHDKKSRGSINLPEPRRLFQFTRSVTKYVENVLPAKESGRRRRSRSKLDSGSHVSDSPTSLTPAAMDGTGRSMSSVSSERGETRSVPEDRTETSSGCTRCSSTCVHVGEHGKRNTSRVKLRMLPGLAEVLGHAEEVGQREFLVVPERPHDGTDHSRKLHYSYTSPTRSSPSHYGRTSLGANSIENEPESDLHEATSSIASEDFETWWQTRGVPEQGAFTALEQEAQLVHGNDAYDDVSSEDEIERTHWRVGHDRSVSPEDVPIQSQVRS